MKLANSTRYFVAFVSLWLTLVILSHALTAYVMRIAPLDTVEVVRCSWSGRGDHFLHSSLSGGKNTIVNGPGGGGDHLLWGTIYYVTCTPAVVCVMRERLAMRASWRFSLAVNAECVRVIRTW